MKKVLILCTGNSCRSIIAEALTNRMLESRGVKAYSAGSAPSGRVHPDARRVLEAEGAWEDRYRSKSIDEAMEEGPFDLVVTVCDNAKERCPLFPGGVRTIHVGFEDPDGKPYEAFVETKERIKKRLVPIIEEELLK
ncbi:arsenate reductase ArsC [Hydrogenimonas sp.]